MPTVFREIFSSSMLVSACTGRGAEKAGEDRSVKPRSPKKSRGERGGRRNSEEQVLAG